MEEEEDRGRQEEEIATLSAIFDVDFFIDPSAAVLHPYKLLIRLESDDSSIEPIALSFSTSPGYPSKKPPEFGLRCSWLSDVDRKKLEEALIQQFSNDVVLFQWADWLRENAISFLGLEEKFRNMTTNSMVMKSNGAEEEVKGSVEGGEFEEKPEDSEEEIDIFTGEPITDRKSKFVAHVAEVFSERDVDRMVEQLKNSSKKIATATHNIVAYRFEDGERGGILVEGRDDDGEGGAGDKLLFMLQQKNHLNLCVIVTRWYGGIQLGADRFKHITNIAKETIEVSGKGGKEKNKKTNSKSSSSSYSGTTKKDKSTVSGTTAKSKQTKRKT